MDQTIGKHGAADYARAHDLSSIAHVAPRGHDGDSIERAVQNALEACGIVILDSDACSVPEHGGSEQSREDASSHDDGNNDEEPWGEEDNTEVCTESKPDLKPSSAARDVGVQTGSDVMHSIQEDVPSGQSSISLDDHWGGTTRRREQEKEGHHSSACKLCGKTFLQKDNLEEHLMKHEEAFPLRCRMCQKGFFLYANLCEHMKVSHSTTRVFPQRCRVCHKVMLRHRHLLNHVCRKGFHSTKAVQKREAVVIDNTSVCKKSTSEMCQLSKSINIEVEQTDNDYMSEEVSAQNIQNESTIANITGPRLTDCMNIPDKEHTNANTLARKRVRKKSREHVCIQCGKSFIQKIMLKDHLIVHQGEYPLRCGLCMKGYDRRADVLGHMICVHSAKTKQVSKQKALTYDCEECGKSFAFKSSYQRHIGIHFQHLFLKCQKCNSVFLHQNQMVDHMKCAHANISGNKFSELCMKDATLLQSVRENVRKVPAQSLQNDSPKDVSHFEDSSKDLAEQKVDKRGNAEVLQCGNGELQETILKDCVDKDGKKSASHKLEIKGKKSGKESGAHICSVCGKSFKTNGGLTDHLMRHKGKYRLRCGLCMKGFMNIGEVAGHMICVHSTKTKQVLKGKASPYLCEECGKIFTFKSNYQRHVGTHFHHSVFKCRSCNQVFPQQNQMLEHMKRAHENISANVFSELCVEDAKHERSVRKNVRKVPVQSLQNDSPKDVSHSDDSSINIGTEMTICEDTGEKSGYSSAEEASKRNDQCRPHLCTSCGKSFKHKGKLKDHLIKHTGIYPLKCALCKKGFRRPTQVIAHFNNHHRKRNEKNGNVGEYASSYEQLFDSYSNTKDKCRNAENKSSQNKQSEVQSDILNCDDLGKNFVPLCKGGKMTCPVCGKIFIREAFYHRHLKFHDGPRFHCTPCNKTFKRKASLCLHNKKNHSEDSASEMCHICGKGFWNSVSLKRHIDLHKGLLPKPFKCDRCPKSFRSRAHRKSHMVTHSEERPFQCDVCGKAFKLFAYIRLHKRTHTGEKPFSCTACTRAFASRANLSDHMRLHTGAMPFECEVCHKKFAQSAGLYTHRKTHKNK